MALRHDDVVWRAGVHAGVSEADPLGVLGEDREEDLGGRAVAELAGAVVLHGPPAAEVVAVRELGLLDGDPVDARLLARRGELGPLELREDVEDHA